MRQLAAQKVSKSEIARRLSIGRTSVRRILGSSSRKRGRLRLPPLRLPPLRLPPSKNAP